MIAHLRGRVLASAPGQVIVECGGVGYDVAISIATYAALPEVGREAALHIYTNVREDQIALFGFMQLTEKRIFERLIAVSGIGPKLGLTVLSGLSADRLVQAIRTGDQDMLVKIPGIGKKTAERVVLELKDKLDDLAVPGLATVSSATPHAAGGELGEDVLSALMNLGYPRAAAWKAVEAAVKRGDADGFEALFRAAMAAVR
jgi:Holliday junction DNA helicase RuvA